MRLIIGSFRSRCCGECECDVHNTTHALIISSTTATVTMYGFTHGRRHRPSLMPPLPIQLGCEPVNMGCPTRPGPISAPGRLWALLVLLVFCSQKKTKLTLRLGDDPGMKRNTPTRTHAHKFQQTCVFSFFKQSTVLIVEVVLTKQFH